MNKGMAYTIFAMLSASMILTLVMLPVVQSDSVGNVQANRITQASFFVESIESDMDRALGIATRRALTGATNYVVVNGEPLVNPEKNISSALVNGTISGQELNNSGNASLNDWADRVSNIAEDSGFRTSIELENYSFTESGFDVVSSYAVFIQLKDPSTQVTFNRSSDADSTVSIVGLEDTMLLLRSQGRYVNTYSRCDFDDPADMLYTGNQNSTGYTQGFAVVNPSDLSSVSNRSEKILVVDDADSYTADQLNQFEGSVSAEPVSIDPGQLDPYYVYDTGSIAGIETNDSVILDNDEVWQAHFRTVIDEGCYMSSSRGPGIRDRLSNDLVSPNGTGLVTLMDVTELPPELQKVGSAAPFVYFNESGNYGSVSRIKGVSSEYSAFRLDQYHVDTWGLNGLVE